MKVGRRRPRSLAQVSCCCSYSLAIAAGTWLDETGQGSCVCELGARLIWLILRGSLDAIEIDLGIPDTVESN
jgi:hypothetical protein